MRYPNRIEGASPGQRAARDALLAPLVDINAAALDALAAVAHAPQCETAPSLASRVRPELQTLSAAARAQLCAAPVCLADAGFQDELFWGTVTGGTTDLPSRVAPDRSFGTYTRQIALLLIPLAWTLARSAPEVVRIAFAMSPATAEAIASLRIQRVSSLAEQYSHYVWPVWPDDPLLWRALLTNVDSSENRRLPPVQLRILQRRLAQLSLATRAKLRDRELHAY
jgi:hypothetical protein